MKRRNVPRKKYQNQNIVHIVFYILPLLVVKEHDKPLDSYPDAQYDDADDNIH